MRAAEEMAAEQEVDEAQREAAEAMMREMAGLEREKVKQVEMKRVMDRERER